MLYCNQYYSFPIINETKDVKNVSSEKPSRSRFLNRKSLLLYLVDTTFFLCGFFIAQGLCFAVKLAYQTQWRLILGYLLILGLCVVTSRLLFRIYHNIWRFPNTRVYLELILSDFAAGLVAWAIGALAGQSIGLPFAALTSMCVLLLTLSSRFVYRILFNYQEQRHADHRIKVAIVGASQNGVLLANELLYNKKSAYAPFCFIDTDTHKTGSLVSGIKVYAENDSIIEFLKKSPVQEIFITVSDKDGEKRSRLYEFYKQTGCKIKLYDFPVREYGKTGADSSIAPSAKRQIREFKIEDLLFRDTQKLQSTEVRTFLSDKVVLVTGGGGSIGSELCRQIAKCAPRALIILDIYENNAYDIQQELAFDYPQLSLHVEIASVRDRARLDCIFAHYRPDVVFHAAAHKHVPLMEHSSCEAIKNNVLGTYNTADMAEKHGTKKFILISTDKAVNPTNVMGASKRLCEMVIQCRTDSKTSFAAVRFGNVLGSNGSVIPLFRRQIEAGGPITLTDKRIIRYFMTIPEAAQLVMQAGALATSGELFVLDMGKPVKILELAENMIRLSGLEPYTDIEIKEIGLRPGEKLYEELLMHNESLSKTTNHMIFIEKDTPLSREAVEEKLAILREAVLAAEDELSPVSIREAMMQVVPTYHTPESVNRDAANAREMQMV